MPKSLWVAHLAVGCLFVLGHGLLPPGALQDAVYATAALTALAGLAWGIRRNRPPRRRAWLLLGAGAALWVTGDIVWGALGAGVGLQASPWVTDLLYLLGYPLLAAGLWQVSARASRAGNVIAVLDTLIVTTAMTLVLWVVVVETSWTEHGSSTADRAVGLLHPIADAVLVAYLVHLLMITRRRSAALLLLAAGFAVVLASDVVHQLAGVHPSASGPPSVETLWLITYFLWSTAALHPDMATVGAAREPGVAVEGSSTRVLYLAAATLLLPGVLLVESALGLPVHGTAVGLVSVVVIGLLAARLIIMIRRLQEQANHLVRLADTDFLTGLLNRRRFVHHLSRLTAEIRRGEREGSAALLVVGLYRFTEINDTLGHRIGDDLLRAVAGRLTEHRCEGAVPARLGGDVFGILLPHAGTADHAMRCAMEVTELLSRPFVVSDLGVDVQAGVGLVLTPEDGVDPAVLLHQADVAMSAARERSDHVARFDATMEVGGALAPELMADLGDALDERRIVVHYQPQISLCTGQVVGAEALVRWQHPVHGLLAPGAFVPAAERTGQIRPLTRYVLDAALEQCAQWQECGPYTVAVNLSVRNLLDPRIVDDVREALQRHGVDPGRVELEITETSAMVDPERSGQTLRALHALGVVLSIDDYGTGYGSLAYLQELPVSRLKIDRTFVAGLRDSEASKAIVRSTVDLAQRLGLSVVAEGVEDDETLVILRDMRCDLAQGYGIARPLPADRLAEATEAIRARVPAQLGVAPSATGEVPQPRAELPDTPAAARLVPRANGTTAGVPGRNAPEGVLGTVRPD